MPDYQFIWPRTGHDAPARILQQSVRQGSLAHAYLFFGPAGIGKKGLVNAFVTSLLCSDTKVRPCNVCDSCRAAARGLHTDLHWISPETDSDTISVAQIRALKRLVHLRSVSQAPKVAIITEAGSMTLLAANALLKVLEEPPAGVIFILIADSLRMLPATVLSRCQLIRCRPVSDSVLMDILDPISADPVLKEMVRASASGRVRYAMEMLADNGAQYQARTEAMLGVLESPLLSRFLRTSELAQYTPATVEIAAATGPTTSHDTSLDTLESLLHDMLLSKSGVQGLAHTSYSERLRAIVGSLQLSELYRMLTGISDLRMRLATHAHAQLAWEHFFINS